MTLFTCPQLLLPTVSTSHGAFVMPSGPHNVTDKNDFPILRSYPWWRWCSVGMIISGRVSISLCATESRWSSWQYSKWIQRWYQLWKAIEEQKHKYCGESKTHEKNHRGNEVIFGKGVGDKSQRTMKWIELHCRSIQDSWAIRIYRKYGFVIHAWFCNSKTIICNIKNIAEDEEGYFHCWLRKVTAASSSSCDHYY